jgi:hypothetical protein
MEWKHAKQQWYRTLMAVIALADAVLDAAAAIAAVVLIQESAAIAPALFRWESFQHHTQLDPPTRASSQYVGKAAKASESPLSAAQRVGGFLGDSGRFSLAQRPGNYGHPCA